MSTIASGCIRAMAWKVSEPDDLDLLNCSFSLIRHNGFAEAIRSETIIYCRASNILSALVSGLVSAVCVFSTVHSLSTSYVVKVLSESISPCSSAVGCHGLSIRRYLLLY